MTQVSQSILRQSMVYSGWNEVDRMKKGEKLFSYILLAFSALCIVGSLFIIPFNELTMSSPGGYPIFVAGLCFVFAAIIAFVPRKAAEDDEEKLFDTATVLFIVLLILYVIAIIYLHYTIATLLFLFAAIFFLRNKDWRSAVLISFICTFLILLLFKYIFSVILP